ncbi:MAG: AmmeMemoRadiSam system protein B, partial [Chloroflexi bacterium]|nr:AmmeMemoRadiSam system protein B [Chloroflexota bacterium]
MTDIRPSPIAGRWYPGSAKTLSDSVDRYLADAKVEPPPGELVAVIAPHAGHQYSGHVAAHAFKCAQGLDVEIAAVICPSHYIDITPLITTSHEAYSTPLGTVLVDREAIEQIAKSIPLMPVARDPEHALE